MTNTAHTERETRYVVGIDLGTTNVAVCYVDLEGETTPHQFAVPQLVSAGEMGAADLLPSFCYLPGTHELPEGALSLPWDDAPTHAVGVFARDQGAAVPDRLVTSAKSWLAHAGVNRTRGILPWGSDLGEQMVSPVDVSRCFLEHVCRGWDQHFATQRDRFGTPCTLAEQQVILTVPASFDEAARELTVDAARAAGIRNLTLIEEPLAAFYAWLWRHADNWQETLSDGDTVLVVDVGGGTTDFSLITVEGDGSLRRTAVGNHLLLGGDNMDMALARQCEAAWGARLHPREWSLLVQQCRRAKERLLAEDAPEHVPVTIAGLGSSVIASSRTHDLARTDVQAAMLEGFFPSIAGDSAPVERRRGIQEMGLPFAADPAVTRHLLQFLRQAPRQLRDENAPIARPTHILYNGGALLPGCLRTRVTDTVAAWCGGRRPTDIAADELALAVSRGAAYYGLVRRGVGARVRGGIARSYYLEVGTAEAPELLCVMPRDTEEGVVQHVEDRSFSLAANRPVRFPLSCSATRLGDRLGQIVTERQEITDLPALHTAVAYGKGGQRKLDVSLSAVLNEVGTFDIWCTTADGQHRFPLRFDLRSEDASASLAPGLTVEASLLEAACEAVRETFAGDGDPRPLAKQLESVLDLPRGSWGVPVLRPLADVLLAHADGRRRTPQHEARWLNLTGFCVRPGFGAAGDEWRLRELWKVWLGGPASPRNAQVAAEWWTCWRRVAGGFRSGHQQQVANGLIKELVPTSPSGRLNPKKRGNQEAREMWRALGALERLSVKSKGRICRALARSTRRLERHHWWVLARVGARRLFHGPADAVIPPPQLAPVLNQLLRRIDRNAPPKAALFALANMGRLCGVRGLDIGSALRDKLVECLRSGGTPDGWVAQLQNLTEDESDYQAELMGDALPLGLALSESDRP